jgi:X-X-X-Leu-X-X-Gly heptad repeat protein
MLRLARYSVRQPKRALLGWAIVAVALTLIGFGISHSLSPSITIAPGTESSRAQQLATARFGPTQLVPILLQGPKAQLDTQGPQLVAALVKRPHTRALSAWDAGIASAGLRPSSTAAMIVVSVDRSEADAVNYDEPQIERLVARTIHLPVRASITGQPSIDRALRSEALSATRRAELIAVGILFLLLLIGLRAPLAAVTVTLIGAATVTSSFGLMALLGKVMPTDPIAVALGSMSGLALGVAFALLILDRAHQEGRHPEADPRDAALAATAAVQTTGRAVLVAGSGLILALLLAVAIAPTKILASLGVGVLVCATFAVGAAVVVMPSALVLFGRGIGRVAFHAPATVVRDWDRLVRAGAWVRHRAVLAGALATAALLALAVPVFSLATGPPGIAQLPTGNQARVAFEEVARVMGAGWPTPYNMIVVNPAGPVTTQTTLNEMESLQTTISHDPSVVAVTGPGTLSSQTQPLGAFPGQLKQSSALLTAGPSSLAKLIAGLGQAGAGAKQLHSGLLSATSGAGQLHSGSGTAQSGAAQLHAGLTSAHTGSAQLSAGLRTALAGATALKSGATQALAGSIDLKNGIGSAAAPVAAGLPALKQLASLTASTSAGIDTLQPQAQGAASDVAAATAALQSMGVGKTDPRYGDVLSALQAAGNSTATVATGLANLAPGARTAAALAATAATQTSYLSAGLAQLSTGAAQLEAGIAKLEAGNSQLASGMNSLAGGGGTLTGGLAQLDSGAGQLQTGLLALTTGAGQLGSGLAGGVTPTGQLVNGLGIMQRSVAQFRGQLPSAKDLQLLQQQSPHLFNSGYFLLAAIAGAPAASSNAATFTVNTSQGGNAGQIVIIPKYGSSAQKTAALGTYLARLGRTFAAKNHLQVAVGGPAGSLADYTSATNARLPWVIAALAVLLALTLGIALRAVALPIVAILFDLLTAAATFGVLTLLFGGSHPPLGGPGYIDPMSIIGVFTAIFGISLVFLVVLLARTREEFVAGASVDEALDVALRRTAAATTGAGLLMVAAVIPFIATQLLTVRAFGIAVAVAVLLDAFIVRPVLLPAAVEVLGPRAWWPTKPPPGDRAVEPPLDGTPEREQSPVPAIPEKETTR